MANTKDLKYKEYVKLRARHDELWKKLSKLPSVKLDKPYQKGWIISFDVRADIKKRADYPVIKEALERGYYDSYTNNVKVVKAIRTKDHAAIIKGKWNSNLISDFYPKRNIMTEAEHKVSKSLSKYFELDTTSERYIKYHRRDYYCTFPSYWLVLKVKPYMITHRHIKGGALQKEYDHIHNRLWYSGEFNCIINNYGKSFPAIKERTRIRGKIRKFLSGDAEDIFNEKVPLEYTY